MENLGRFILKLISIFVAGIMISMIMLTNVDTYSWFTSSFNTEMTVSAASTEDILEEYEIVTDNDGNAIAIILKKAQSCTQDPIIYFSVTGEASKYTLHINPIKLDTYEECEIPIRISLHYGEEKNIKDRRKDNIPIVGNIKVKYLNEFVNEGLDFSFTPIYIYSFLNRNIEPNTTQIASEGKILFASNLPQFINEEDYNKYLYDSIIDSVNQRSWNEVKWTYDEQLLEKEEALNPISKLELTEEQSGIIDIIIPKLRQYIDKLYSIIESLIKQVNEKIAQIHLLNMRIAELEEENSRLISGNQTLQQIIDELEQSPINAVPIQPGTNTNPSSPAEVEEPIEEHSPKENPSEDEPIEDSSEDTDPIEDANEPISGGEPDNQNSDDDPGEILDEDGIKDGISNEDSDDVGEDKQTEEENDYSNPSTEFDNNEESDVEESSDVDAPIESEESEKEQEYNLKTIDIIDKLYDTDRDNTEKDDINNNENDNGNGNEGVEYSSQVIKKMMICIAKYNN